MTRGGSYRGMMQWKVMAQNPPALKASVPTASVYPGHDYPNPKGIFMSYATRWLGYTSGRTDNDQWFGNTDYWKKKYEKLYKNYMPFRKLGELTGTNNKAFQKWLDHPTYDNYWDRLAPSPSEYAEINHPILTITGYFDGDQPGALRYYREHVRQADSSARANHYLLAGPYSHSGTRSPKRELGGFTFGDNAVIDMERLHVKWFNWILRDSTRPSLLKDRVTYYTMGSNEWNYASSLEGMSPDTLTFYLSSPENSAKDVFHSGFLQHNPPSDHHTTRFTYNPLDTTAAKDYLKSTRKPYLSEHEAFQKEHLIYHSPPLKDTVQLSGQIQLKTYLSLNVPDTDVAAYLYAILPDGQSLYLGQDMMRTRYGRDWSRKLTVKRGTVRAYWFDGFYLTSRQLPKGTRFRLTVGPLNTPSWQKITTAAGR